MKIFLFVKKISLIMLKTVLAILVAYAIIFSIATTVGLFLAYQYINKPIKDVKYLTKENPSESTYMSQYRQKLKQKGLSDSLHFKFVPFDSISIHLRQAVLAAEDDGFYTHPGFDIEAILSAIEYNRSRGGIKRGASTITQQLAKNLFLSGERTFERKGKELAYTLLLEHYLGKERIFELYLNYAQWGKQIFGCEAASRYYYKKSCKNLTRSEAAHLAAILAMPERMSPFNTKSSFMNKRIAVIANNLYLQGNINDSGYLNLTGTLPAGKDTIDSVSVDSSLSEIAQ